MNGASEGNEQGDRYSPDAVTNMVSHERMSSSMSIRRLIHEHEDSALLRPYPPTPTSPFL